MTRLTFHMLPLDRWEASDPRAPYAAPSLATEGFIHCTDGETALVATANRHYGAEPGEFVALTVDLEATGSPWRVDDAAGIYPHVFGSIERVAILDQAPLSRDADGRFVGLGARRDS